MMRDMKHCIIRGVVKLNKDLVNRYKLSTAKRRDCIEKKQQCPPSSMCTVNLHIG